MAVMSMRRMPMAKLPCKHQQTSYFPLLYIKRRFVLFCRHIALRQDHYECAVLFIMRKARLDLANKNLPNEDPAQDSVFKIYQGYGINNKALLIEYEGNRVKALELYQKALKQVMRSNKHYAKNKSII